ncbi:hypothetical protein D3C80_856510 [compost metagenome]
MYGQNWPENALYSWDYVNEMWPIFRLLEYKMGRKQLSLQDLHTDKCTHYATTASYNYLLPNNPIHLCGYLHIGTSAAKTSH